MPHIVIEYSDNLKNEIKDSGLTQKAHKAVLDSELFSPEAVKARSLGYSDYVLPEGASNFIHITVSILDGRSKLQRESLSQSVFDAAKNAVPNCEKLSVDIHEMSADTYRK